MQFLGLVSKGLCDRQIATQMSVAYSTARKHRENIYLKLGFNSPAEMVVFYQFRCRAHRELNT